MADALQTVKDMAADAEKGRTPVLLAEFLRKEFPRRPGGWLWRWLSGPCTYDVSKLEPFPDGGFFRTSCVFSVFARDHLLEGAVLPSGGTYGLFSLGASGLRYLNHHQDHVEEVLRDEGRSLEECGPAVLASFVSEALGRDHNSSHDLVESQDHLAQYKGALSGFGGGYELNVREWDRVRTSIVSPVLSGNAGTGWQLEFCSVFGWMHKKQVLMRHRFRFSSDCRIEHEKQILSRRIFKSTPGVRY